MDSAVASKDKPGCLSVPHFVVPELMLPRGNLMRSLIPELPLAVLKTLREPADNLRLFCATSKEVCPEVTRPPIGCLSISV